MFNILNSLVVSIHANISQETDIVEQIGEFISGMLEKLRYGARLFSSKGDFDDFISLVIVTLIRNILNLRSSIFYFEFESIINRFCIMWIFLTIEKLAKNDLLIISHYKIITSNK